MNKHIKKLIICSIVCALTLSGFGVYSFNSISKKDSYLIMTSNNAGGYIISTKKMTSSKADKLRKTDNVAIVEKDVMVTGLEKKGTNNSHKKIGTLLKNKKIHEKVTKHKSANPGDPEWNMQQVNADSVNQQGTNNNNSTAPIKVCIIDSGIDNNLNTDVYLRKNFIPGADGVSIVYEDTCGHGSNVSGIIAAKASEAGISGINSNVQLYSAKVLDASCQAPVSRVVDAIYWAISQGVNIINISFGTTTDSAALKQAIQDASDAGILIIAAAGNNGVVEYPAAYDEVMAIGSVDNEGIASDYSPNDSKVELVAPGDLILSTGDFGGLSVHSGTSMSAPHVTGIASVLWQKDPTVSAAFIRALLDASANLYDGSAAYGYGLVDLNYSLSIYDTFKASYDQVNFEDSASNNALESSIANIADNTSAVAVFDDNSYVEGSWLPDQHSDLVRYAASTINFDALKAGALANDDYIAHGLTNPQWHGYWHKDPVGEPQEYISNYMACYIQLTKIAAAWADNDSLIPSYTTIKFNNLWKQDKDNIYGIITKSGFNNTPWEYALNKRAPYVPANNSNIKDFLYGVAIHSATDIFAHSTYTLSGTSIDHTVRNGVYGSGKADIPDFIKLRYDCATIMAQTALAHAAKPEAGNISDFLSIESLYMHSSLEKFHIKKYLSYYKAVAKSLPYNNSLEFLYNINVN